jgi:hypothetical protein
MSKTQNCDKVSNFEDNFYSDKTVNSYNKGFHGIFSTSVIERLSYFEKKSF